MLGCNRQARKNRFLESSPANPYILASLPAEDPGQGPA
jgi:hypothetical protein